MEPFISLICLFGANFAPLNWAFCAGGLLSPSQNAALFSLIGTTYGGNGRTTFALPDLRGRVPIGFGQGTDLSGYMLGQRGGTETVTLISDEIPPISIKASAADGTETTPGANGATTLAASNALRATASNIYNNQTPTVSLNTGQTDNQPHENIQPYLAVNYIIALKGIYPTRE